MALHDAVSSGESSGEAPSGGASSDPLWDAGRRKQLSRFGRLKRDWWLLLLGLPGIFLILLFHYVPLLGNVIAFKDYQPYIGIWDSAWSGLRNFEVIFNGDAEFINALTNTLLISFVQIFFVFPVPICLALLLNSLLSDRMKRIVQSILYLPHFMSWVIVVAIFQEMLGNAGMLNNFLRSHDLGAMNIIGNPDVFIGLITVQVTWKESGWGTILFLAALSRIDVQLYEASAVDGASRIRQLWHVTLPGIRPVIVLLLILRLGDILTVGFEQILLQQPAVGNEVSDVLDTYVYSNGILAGDWGTSAAVGLVKGVLGVVLVLAANKFAHMLGERGLYESTPRRPRLPGGRRQDERR